MPMSPMCKVASENASADYDPFDEAISVAPPSMPVTPTRGRSRSLCSRGSKGASRSRSKRGRSSSGSSGACSPPPGVALRHDAGLPRLPKPPRPMRLPPPPPPTRKNSPAPASLAPAPPPKPQKCRPEEQALAPEGETRNGGEPVIAPSSPVQQPKQDMDQALVRPPPPPPPMPLGERLTAQDVKAMRRHCTLYLSGACPRGQFCRLAHPGWRLAAQLRAYWLSKPCRYGSKCTRKHCLFAHGEPAETKSAAVGRGRSRSPLPPRGISRSPSGSRSRSRSSDSTYYSSDSESAISEPASSLLKAPTRAPAQFLQCKLEPDMLFDGPQFLVASKPAGWTADTSQSGSGVKEMKEYPGSGWVEPLHEYLAYSARSWYPVLSPAASVSGWALVARSSKSMRCLADIIRSGAAASFSMALVEGPADPMRLSAIARREDGFLEAAALATYGRYSDGGWSGEAGVEKYTLLLIKAMGSACGGERAILPLVWGSAAVGDTEHGGRGAAELFGSRPFFHYYSLSLPDPWAGEAGLSITCPLPADLRKGLALMWTSSTQELHKVLVDGKNCLPQELCYLAGSESPANITQTIAEPMPFGGKDFHEMKKVSRHQWIVSFVQQALRRAEEYGLRAIPGTDQVALKTLLERFPTLRQACWHQEFQLVLSLKKKDPTQALEVDAERKLVRRRSACERLQIFVERYVSDLPPSSKVMVSELVENAHIRNILCESELPQKPILACLRPCPLFDVDPESDALTLHPAQKRLRLGAEHIFEKPDKHLNMKLQDGSGSVPLSWFCKWYRPLLLGGSNKGLQMKNFQIPISAAQLAEAASALEDSPMLIVDRSTLSIQRRFGQNQQSSLQSPSLQNTRNSHDISGAASPPQRQWMEHRKALAGPSKRTRRHETSRIGSGSIASEHSAQPLALPHEHLSAALDPTTLASREVPTPARSVRDVNVKPKFSNTMLRRFRKLLQHYFEPFNLQHNRLLLYSVQGASEDADSTGSGEEVVNGAAEGCANWRWPAWRVVKAMARIDAILSEVAFGTRWTFLQEAFKVDLIYIRLVSPTLDEPLFELTYTPDFRMPVVQPFALCDTLKDWIGAFFVKSKEVLPATPDRAAVVLSYSLACSTEAGARTLSDEKRLQFIVRQLMTYSPDIICLQSLEAHITTARGTKCTNAGGSTGQGMSCNGLGDDSMLSRICSRMECQDYEWWAAPVQAVAGSLRRCGHANVVLWKRSMWRAVSHLNGQGGALYVELEPQKGMIWQMGIGCLEASNFEELCENLKTLKDFLPSSSAGLPSVLCGAFGVEPPRVGAALRTVGISSFRSAHREVLGKEPTWTEVMSEDSGCRSTDGIWLGGGSSVIPLAVMGDHAQEPPRYQEENAFAMTFPSDHLPLLTALKYQPV